MSITLVKKYISLSAIAYAVLSLSVQAADKIETLDVMVLYTSDIQKSDYKRDLDARFAYLEDYTNQTFKNSRVNIQIRIVHSGPTPKKYNRVLTDSRMSSIERNDDIASLRKKHGADFVVVIGTLSGHYCGKAYMNEGDPKTGLLYSYARENAFSYNDYECDALTFAHELGHNMGLDHSVRRDSEGGVWPWAIGHGKDGKWVTTMSYKKSYNAPKYVQYFSNPKLNKECDGDSCGIYNKADASKNLNLLASQFADFMPTVYASTSSSGGGSNSSSGGSTSSGGSSSSSGSSTSTNNPLSNNFDNGLQGWRGEFGAVVKYDVRGGVNATGGMSISKRSKRYQGARKDLKGLLDSNTSYTLEADIFVDGKKREKFKPYLYRKIAGTNKVWIKMGSRTISPGSWQKIKMTMHVPDVKNADTLDLFFTGPKKGVDMKLDNIRITRN